MIKTACDSWKHQLVQCQLNYVKWRKFLGQFRIFQWKMLDFPVEICQFCMFHMFEDIGGYLWGCKCLSSCPEMSPLILGTGTVARSIQRALYSYSIYSYSYPYINLLPIRVTLIPGTSTSSTEARFLGETMHRHWILVYAILQQINCNNIRYIYNAIHIQYTCTTHQAKQLLWGSERVSHLRL